MKKLYVMVLFFINLFFVNGQQTIDFSKPRDNYDPLFKLTDIPVSLNNGMTNIEIPFYTIPNKDIDLPIKLSYYSRGQKLSEIASEVGLGWNLNVPYKISRLVADSEDEGSNGYFSNSIYKDGLFNDKGKIVALASTLLSDSKDLEPDKFYFNLPNYSGKFIYDQVKGDFILQDFEPYKIERTLNQTGNLTGFKVIDPNGNTFFFGENFTKISQPIQYVYNLKAGGGYVNHNLNENGYPSSWYLYKIITKNKEEVTINYISHSMSYFDRGYEISKYTLFPNYPEEQSYNSYFNKLNIIDWLVDNISFKGGNIKFNYSAREDLLSGKRLDNVVVKNSQNIPIKTINLNYFYTTSPLDNSNSHPHLLRFDQTARKRLFLDHVLMNNAEITKFSYNNPEKLPNRFSNSFDLWGFYNNKSNGSFVDINGLVNNSNQTINPLVTSYGLLKQITYPTKGTTAFEYENNTGYLNIYDSKVVFKDLPYVKPVNPDTIISLNKFNYETANHFSFSKEFIVPKKIDETKVDIEFLYNNLQDGDHPEPLCEFVMAFILDKNNQRIKLNASGTITAILPGTNKFTLPNSPLIIGEKYKLNVSFVNCQSNTNYDNMPFFDLMLTFNKIIDRQLIYGEGNRIKSITNNSNNGKIENKNYVYKSLDHSTHTGEITGYPYFYTILGYRANAEKTKILDPFGIKPGSLMSSYNVNSLIYGEVTEYLGDTIQNNGKIHYTFSKDWDGGKYYRWPYYTSIDNEYLRGKILNKKVYNNVSNQYNLISEEINHYEFKDFYFESYINLNNGPVVNDGEKMKYYLRNKDGIVFPIPRFYYNLEGHFSPNTLPPDDFFLVGQKSERAAENLYFQPFYYVSAKKYLTTQENIQYFDNGASITTETNYNYDSANHLQLTSQTTKNSKGEIITTEYQYPPDLTSGYTDSNKMSQLVLQNRISEPVITKQKVGNTYISEIHNQYAEFNGILQKSILHQKKGSGIDVNKTDDRKVIYSSYDNRGNLTQYALQNGISVAIIWGYNGQYPIAKIEGAAYSEVSAYISDLETKSNDGSLTKDSFNTLRTAFPHAMITTYVYQPLVGVTSITAPNGQTEYYKYDAANRLEEIRNDKKEVIKTFKYNYKQP